MISKELIDKIKNEIKEDNNVAGYGSLTHNNKIERHPIFLDN
jgi:hypothetical protein